MSDSVSAALTDSRDLTEGELLSSGVTPETPQEEDNSSGLLDGGLLDVHGVQFADDEDVSLRVGVFERLFKLKNLFLFVISFINYYYD